MCACYEVVTPTFCTAQPHSVIHVAMVQDEPMLF